VWFFCGRVYCDILSIFLIPQFCLFLRHQTMDKVQKHNSFNTNSHSASQKILPPSLLYGILRFITVSTTAHRWSLSWARGIQSTPSHPISLRYILITSYLRLGLSGESYLQVSRPKCCTHFSLLPCALYAPPIYLPWLHSPNNIWREIHYIDDFCRW